MKCTITRAFFVGRFQPFHIGHLRTIKHILYECDEVVIGVGSPNRSYELDNPFTAGERIDMIQSGMSDISNLKYSIVPIEDTDNDMWVSKIENTVPDFNVVYTNNKLVQLLFEERGYKVINQPMEDRENLSGKNIREQIMNRESLKDSLMPRTIVSLGGLSAGYRLRKLREIG